MKLRKIREANQREISTLHLFIYLQNEQSHRQTATWEPHLTLTFVRQIAGKDTGVQPDDFHFFSFEIEINLYSVEKKKNLTGFLSPFHEHLSVVGKTSSTNEIRPIGHSDSFNWKVRKTLYLHPPVIVHQGWSFRAPYLSLNFENSIKVIKSIGNARTKQYFQVNDPFHGHRFDRVKSEMHPQYLWQRGGYRVWTKLANEFFFIGRQ